MSDSGDPTASIRPTGHVVAVLESSAQVRNALDALDAIGIGDDAVDVYCGDEGEAALDPSGRAQGLKGRIVRFVGRISDEHEVLVAHHDAVADGKFVVTVDSGDDHKADVATALKEHGASNVRYFAKATIEQLGE